MNLKHYIPTYKQNELLKPIYKFTIFTPAYNRADTIHRVFDSLEKLTYLDFEFIVINDGSTDNTHQVIQQHLKTTTFKTTYINNEKNQHKMACLFQGVKLAKGEFFLIFDSDDECTPDALDILLNQYNEIPEDLKPTISGVTGLCKDQNGHQVGNNFPEQPYFSNTFERICNFPDSGEKWGFTKTQVLKNIQMNDAIFAKGYIPESLVWCVISNQKFKTKYINKIIRIYYLGTGNAISNKDHAKDAFGQIVFSLSFLNWFQDTFPKQRKVFLRRLYALLRASNSQEFSKSDYINAIENKTFKLFFSLGWPFRGLIK